MTNPRTYGFDAISGCPGWVAGSILANSIIKSGDKDRVAVVGAESLSRICDPHDRDGMLYSDGAGVVIFEARDGKEGEGFISSSQRTDNAYSLLLHMSPSYNKELDQRRKFLHMNGPKLFEYATRTVPEEVKISLENAGLTVQDIAKFFVHQANEKLDIAMLKRIFGVGKRKILEIAARVAPMTVQRFGNSSVATIPTLVDLVLRGQMDGFTLKPKEVINCASVGAGMSANSFNYRMTEEGYEFR
jgi:3-oxoacyl-[acyl-carrier-protein] synthase III